MRSRDPKAMIAALLNRANQGDSRATAELQKLKQALAVAQNVAIVKAIDEAEEVLGEEASVFAPDDLEIAAHYSGQHADDLARKVALRGHKWSDLNQVANFARINPPSVLHGIIGNQQIVSSGQTAQVANWAGDDAETTAVTVTLAPVEQLTPVLGAANRSRPFGILQFGTRGFSVKAEIDIGRGTQFTMTASAVTLQVGLEPVQPGDFITTMRLAGMLSFHTTTHVIPVTRTITGATTTQFDCPVPAFGRNVVLWREPAATACQLNFIDDGGNVRYTFALAGGAYMLIPIPIGNDITNVLITGAGGPKAPVILTEIELIFGLAF